MRNRGVVVACVCSMVVLPGCGSLRTAAHSTATQGMLLGGLLGAGTLGLIGSVSDHHRGLGMWAGGGGALGALAGWYVGHQLEEEGKGSP